MACWRVRYAGLVEGVLDASLKTTMIPAPSRRQQSSRAGRVVFHLHVSAAGWRKRDKLLIPRVTTAFWMLELVASLVWFVGARLEVYCQRGDGVDIISLPNILWGTAIIRVSNSALDRKACPASDRRGSQDGTMRIRSGQWKRPCESSPRKPRSRLLPSFHQDRRSGVETGIA